MARQRPAERQRPDVAHEDLGRMGVEPEESEAGAGQGAGEHGQLRGLRNAGDVQIAGEDARGRRYRSGRSGPWR